MLQQEQLAACSGGVCAMAATMCVLLLECSSFFFFALFNWPARFRKANKVVFVHMETGLTRGAVCKTQHLGRLRFCA